MSRVVHFEIMAKQPQQAIDFYSKVLGWKFQKWDNPGMDYWLVTTGEDKEPGINGGLGPGDPVKAVVNTIGVADLDGTLKGRGAWWQGCPAAGPDSRRRLVRRV